MKKRILSCFMALALCLTLLPTAALAADDSHDPHCICGKIHTAIGDHTDSEKTFDGAVVLWDDNGTLKKGNDTWEAKPIEVWPTDNKYETVYWLPDGTYYLGSDIKITQHPIMITGDVKLCLNGKKITCGSTAPTCMIAVYAKDASTLTLTDCKSTGEITGGKSWGVDVRKGYTFNMYDGTITGNGGGVDLGGSTGVTTTFNMYGGKIDKNTGIGVKLEGASNAPTTFKMSGGTISNNKGGVSTGGGTFTMSGTAKITGNTAGTNGGGVNIGNGGTFTMNAGAKITQNTAGYSGGGVYVNGGTFTMSGGEISGNTAGFNGGGVHVTKTTSSSNSAFTMNGGEIKSNTAVNRGGGVFVDNGTFTVSGKPIVNNNTSGSKVTDNVYLNVNKTITIGESGLVKGETEGALIGVTTGVDPADGKPVAITSNAKANDSSCFKADDESKYQIGYNSETHQVQLEAKPKIPLTKDNTTIEITSKSGFVYSGTEITPKVMVTYKGSTDGSKTLNLGTDYTVTSGDSGTAAGQYTLTIEGAGNYTGRVEKTWKITPLTVNVDLQSVKLNGKVYDGKTAGSNDNVSVGFKNLSNQSVILTKGTDYTIKSVTYADANAGIRNADIIIELAENGNYTFAGSNKLTAQVDAQGKITKASADKLTAKTGEINVVNNETKNYTLDLSTLLPTLTGNCGYGTKTYRLVSGLDLTRSPYGNGGTQISNDGVLTLPIKAADSVKDGGQISTGQVKVTTQNYEDITLTINVIASDAPLKDPEYTPPKAKTLTYNGKAQELITGGTATGGTMQYSLTSGSGYSTDIPMATNAGDYTVYYKVVGASGYSNTAVKSIPVHINKAKPTGEPIYTKITAAGKTLKGANLKPNSSWPTGTVKWELPDTTEVKADTAYKWVFTPSDTANYETLTGTVVLYTKSTPVTPSQPGGGGGGSSSDRDSSDSNPIIKTETKNNADGSTTKTETRKDGSVTQTTTGKDGSTSKTETKKDGSSVTENKAADGSTGTIKTDKNGKTEMNAKVSAKAVEAAKKSGEAVKAPVEVEAARNSNAAPTVKVELPGNAGKTEVEIPVSNAKPGTVAVLVHADGTEEILKASVPTENGIRLTVDGSATVKIVDNSKDFIDTRNHWAREEIDFVSARELVNGMSDTIYAPNASATRAQLWTILARQNDADLNGGNTWYEKAQLWSKDKGISDGTEPNAAINRAQMVTMLWRTMGQPAAASGASFADVPADSYYAQAVAWAIENGITAGVGGGRFDPTATCARAQIAAFLARSMK